MRSRVFLLFRNMSILLGILIFSATMFRLYGMREVNQSDSGEEETRYIERLREMDINDLIDEMSRLALSESQNINAIFYHVNILYERIDEVDQSLIMDIVIDDTSAESLRASLLQICKRLSIYSDSFDELFSDDNTPDEVTANLIWAKPVIDDDTSWLEAIAICRNEAVSPFAFHRLELEYPDVGRTLADRVLSDVDIYTTEVVRSAIFAKSTWFRHNFTTEDDPYFVEYINLLMSIVDAAYVADDKWMLDTVACAFIPIPSKTTVMLVISDERFDWLWTVGVVGEHTDVLIEIIKTAPTLESFKAIQKAVEITPNLDVVDVLYEAYRAHPELAPSDGFVVLDAIIESGEGYRMIDGFPYSQQSS